MIALKHNNIKINNKEKITSNSKGMGRYFSIEVPIPSYIELKHANIFLHCKDIKKNVKKQNY